MRRGQRVAMTVVAGLVMAAGSEPPPSRPKSPKATDALKVEAAAVRKVNRTYWAACRDADAKLANTLKTAATLAHARNDGAEEQACLDAAADADARAFAAGLASDATVGPLKPFRFEKK